MIRLFNSSINSHGEYVNLFLASQTFNEGLDLKAVRHIHIFEPLITWASDKQTIGRAARYCSHADLDKSEWDVTIHRYASDFPREIKDKSIDDEEKLDDIKDKIQKLKDIDYKPKIKLIKEEIKKNKDKIKKLIKKPLADESSEIVQLNEENDRLEKEIEDLKEKELVTKENIQKLTKKEKEVEKKAKKPKIDATGVENIDKFIYEESIKKMQKILILYQLMKESAIDCLVLNKFHKNGNQIIKCQDY
jgi:hypothetical protein